MLEGLVNMVFNVGLRFTGGQVNAEGGNEKKLEDFFWEARSPGS